MRLRLRSGAGHPSGRAVRVEPTANIQEGYEVNRDLRQMYRAAHEELAELARAVVDPLVVLPPPKAVWDRYVEAYVAATAQSPAWLAYMEALTEADNHAASDLSQMIARTAAKWVVNLHAAWLDFARSRR